MICALLLVISVLGAAASAAGEEAGVNLLVNPRFEGAEETIPPPGWTLYGQLDEDRRIRVVAADDPANRALLVEDGVSIPRGNAGEIGLMQTVEARPGETYVARVWVKAVPGASTHGAFLQMRFLPSNQFAQTMLNTTNTETFEEFSVFARAPEDTQTVRIYIYTHAAPVPTFLVREAELVAGVALPEVPPEPVPPVYHQLKPLHLETELVAAGQASSLIVKPASGLYDEEAARIQEAIAALTGVTVPVVTDDDPRAAVHIPPHWSSPNALRAPGAPAQGPPPLSSHLIVLGNRSTNKTVSALYDLYFTLLDLKYPGPGGYVVRTLHSPFGDGINVVFVGGSDALGVQRAADVFIERLREADHGPGSLTLGWTWEIQLGEGIQLPPTPDAVETWEASAGYRSSGYFGWNSISKRMALYYMTGDPAYARDFLRLAFPDEQAKAEIARIDGEMIENKDDPLAGPYHYNAHMMILYWDLIEESPVFTDEERLKVTNAFSRQLAHRRGEGIYAQPVPTAVGSRHGQWSAISLYALGRYFQKEYGDRVWDYAVYGALNHFGSLHHYAYVVGESDNLFWYNTAIAPILTYLVMTKDRKPIENGVLETLLRGQEMLISGRVPDWALEYASLGYLHKAAYLTQDGRWLRYRERTGLDVNTFRIGQSFWPDDTLQPADPQDLVGRWSIHRLSHAEWTRREDGLALEESFHFGSFRTAADETGDFILIDGFNGASRNPYHTFAVLELRIGGDTLLSGYNNQVLTRADGMVDSRIAMNAALKYHDVLGQTAAVVAEVPGTGLAHWRRALVQRVGRYALFVDELTFVRDSDNAEVQIKWELDPQSAGRMAVRPIRTSEPVRSTLEGRILTMEWTGPAKKGSPKRFFSLVGAVGGESHALTENASILGLPAPALAVVGAYENVDAQLAVLAGDHLFGVGLTRAELGATLVFASEPIALDWDFEEGVLHVDAPGEVTVTAALAGPPRGPGGEPLSVAEGEDGLTQLRLPPGRHRLEGAWPAAGALAAVEERLAALMEAGRRLRSERAASVETGPAPELIPLVPMASARLGGRIADMVKIPLPGGELIAVAERANVHILDGEGRVLRTLKTDGYVRVLRWWPEYQLLLAGCVDEKVIAFDLEGRRRWEFVSEMDPAVFRAAKQYWFKTAPNLHGIHGLYTGVFAGGESQAFVGSATTLEIIDGSGRLVKRMPVFWGLPSVFAIVPGDGGDLNLLMGLKHNGTNEVIAISSRSLAEVRRGYLGVPPGATYVGGWSAMNRHHLFYEDLAGTGEKVLVGDINGTYNRVTIWDLKGNALFDASFGPGPGYAGRGWRQDAFDNRNVRDMTVIDLDGDGDKEVVVALWTGYVLALDHRLEKVWSYRLESAPTVLGIAEADGKIVLVVGSEDGSLTTFDAAGSPFGRGRITGVPTFMEQVRAGGEIALVVGSDRGEVVWFDALGTAGGGIVIRSPRSGEAISGVWPVRLERHLPAEPGERFSLSVGDQLIYTGPHVPEEVLLDTRTLPDGEHVIVAEVQRPQGRTVRTRVAVNVQNHWELADELLPPVDWGAWGVISRLKAVAKSEGWQWASQPAGSVLDDRDRLIRGGQEPEYLIWEAPNLIEAVVTLYVRSETFDQRWVTLSLSHDGAAFRDVDYDVRMELMGDGWYQARLTLAVDRPQQVRQMRLMLHPGILDTEDLQVGHVWMRGLREEPVFTP